MIVKLGCGPDVEKVRIRLLNKIFTGRYPLA